MSIGEWAPSMKPKMKITKPTKHTLIGIIAEDHSDVSVIKQIIPKIRKLIPIVTQKGVNVLNTMFVILFIKS